MINLDCCRVFISQTCRWSFTWFASFIRQIPASLCMQFVERLFLNCVLKQICIKEKRFCSLFLKLKLVFCFSSYSHSRSRSPQANKLKQKKERRPRRSQTRYIQFTVHLRSRQDDLIVTEVKNTNLTPRFSINVFKVFKKC